MSAGILAFLVMVAYWPGLSGAAVAPRYAVIALAWALVLIGPRLKLTTGHALALLFAAWCALTMTWAQYPLDGIDALGRMVLLAGAFCLGAQLRDLRSLMIGAGLGISVSSAVAMLQAAGVPWIVEAPSPAGLFYNKNFMAEAAALVAIWAIAARLWWLVPLLSPALLMPGARGALLAVIVTVVLMLWHRSRLAAVLAVVLAITLMGYAVLSVSLASGTERMAIWSDTAEHLSLLGVGLGGFVEYFPKLAHHFVMTVSRPGQAHNEFLQIAFETGFVGIVIFASLIGVLLRGELSPAKLVLIGGLVEAFLAFPFQMPATGFLIAVVAGSLSADRDHVRDAIARCGVALCARVFRNAGP